MHTTLQPKTNIRMLVAWGVLAVVIAITTSPVPWFFLGAGLILGTIAGLIQLRALQESAEALVAAPTAIKIRRILNSSRYGRLYLYMFWFSQISLFALAFYVLKERVFFGILGGYFSFTFMRELLTLRGTFELQKISEEQSSGQKEFGVFAPVFKSAHGYLALLHVSASDSVEAVQSVRQCALADIDQSAIIGLLKDLNWRPTLVAAVATAFLPPNPRVIEALWHRFDSGSWVVPQIAVVLSTVDPDFQNQARRRLETHCPLNHTELQALTMIERHTTAGPAGGAERSAKAASALAKIVTAISPPPDWVTKVISSPEHQALIATDIDGGGAIVQSWGERFNEIKRQLL